jgi:hypothetical protein
MLGFVPSSEEDDVTLRGIDIIIFKKENSVNSIFLQCGELDEQAQWPSKRALDDKVFLSSNLSFD